MTALLRSGRRLWRPLGGERASGAGRHRGGGRYRKAPSSAVIVAFPGSITVSSAELGPRESASPYRDRQAADLARERHAHEVLFLTLAPAARRQGQAGTVRNNLAQRGCKGRPSCRAPPLPLGVGAPRRRGTGPGSKNPKKNNSSGLPNSTTKDQAKKAERRRTFHLLLSVLECIFSYYRVQISLLCPNGDSATLAFIGAGACVAERTGRKKKLRVPARNVSPRTGFTSYKHGGIPFLAG